ncbi:MAG: Flagellar biosynthesis protein FlgN [Nitrospira sp.]|nr:MAG: Flagellar biosynthesis protein FlgN [Nitrospira sp.]
MHDKILAFQALLIEEQQAIRTLSFGQFTTVAMRKTRLLDEIRELEQSRRLLSAATGHQESSVWFRQQEAELAAAIGDTDRLNRFNAALIGQSLVFLQGTLRLWQRSPEATTLYSSSGAVMSDTTGMVKAKG